MTRTNISIGMPVKNNARTVGPAIESILHQTFQDWELIVLDDGSTDATESIVKSFDDSRISFERRDYSAGLAVRLNETISMSQGCFFARMDGDDIAYPERLERQVHFLRHNADISLVGTSVLVFYDSGNPIGKRPAPTEHKAIVASPLSGISIAHPTFMGPLEFFAQNRYKPDMLKAQDQELLFRTFESHTFANLPQVLMGLRESELDLRKQARTRLFRARSLCHTLIQRHQYASALRVALEQGLKLSVDAFSIATRSDYSILKHRALPITEQERREWLTVWAKYNG